MRAIGGTGKLYRDFLQRLRTLCYALAYPLGTAPTTGRCCQHGKRRCWRTRGHGHGAMYCERHGKESSPGWLTYAKDGAS